MGEGHLFQTPSEGQTGHWDGAMNKSRLGSTTTRVLGGGNWGCRTSGRGWGKDPLPQKDPDCHEYTVTHTLSSHPAAGVALGDQAVKGNNPLGRGGGGEGSEGLDTRRTGGGREEDLEFIKVTGTPASHIQHS